LPKARVCGKAVTWGVSSNTKGTLKNIKALLGKQFHQNPLLGGLKSGV